MKLFAESVVSERFLSPSNAASWLMFADARSCHQLVEVAMDHCIVDLPTVMKANGGNDWKNIEASLPVLLKLFRYQNVDRTNDNYVSICSLRKQLQESGHPLMDLDGTRETLIERLGSNTTKEDRVFFAHKWLY